MILNKIQEQIYGINITQIAESLSMHRITVTNYVDELEKENRITVQKIGPSKICFMKATDISFNNYQSLFMNISKYYFRSLEEVMSTAVKDSDQIYKQIGKSMSKQLKMPELDNRHSIDINANKRVALDQMADTGLKFLPPLNTFAKTQGINEFVMGEKVKFLEEDKEMAISIKIKFAHLNFFDFRSFYYLIAGFFETVLQDNYGETVNFDVHMIPPEKYVCYYKISIK